MLKIKFKFELGIKATPEPKAHDFSLELVVYACVDIGINALSVHVLNQ